MDDVEAILGPQPPQIVSHPVSQAVPQGSSATFAVTAGGSQPLRYQWRKGTEAIIGATNSSYVIANVQSANTGSYSAVITNAYGSATSASALLVISASPGTTLSQGNLSITLSNASAGISSFRFQGSEIYRIGTYISDWGLQAGSNSVTFVRNANGAAPGQPMFLASADAASANYYGTYTTGGANVDLTREYALLPGSDVLRTRMSFQNNGASSITLRYFETFDVDYLTYYETIADRYTINTNGYEIQIGRSSVVSASLTVMLGSVDPEAIIAACGTNLGITSSAALNSHFATRGADSNGATLDKSLDIAREYVLAPGEKAIFTFYQSVATTLAQSQSALLANLPRVPLAFTAPTLNASGDVQLELCTPDGSPVLPNRAAQIQFYCTTNLALPMSSWVQLTNSPVLTNGILQLKLGKQTNSGPCFFRAMDAP